MPGGDRFSGRNWRRVPKCLARICPWKTAFKLLCMHSAGNRDRAQNALPLGEIERAFSVRIPARECRNPCAVGAASVAQLEKSSEIFRIFRARPIGTRGPHAQ